MTDMVNEVAVDTPAWLKQWTTTAEGKPARSATVSRPGSGAGVFALLPLSCAQKKRRPVEQTVRLQREPGPDRRSRLRLFNPVLWVMVYRLAIPFDKVLAHRGFVIANQDGQILRKKRIRSMEGIPRTGYFELRD